MVARFRRSVWAGDALALRDHLLVHQRSRNLGREHSGGLGLRDHQLRLVDWDWPRWNAYFRYFVASAPGMAHVDQSFRRSDDAFRGGMRSAISAASSRATVAFLLPVPISGHDGFVAAISKSA